MHIAYILTRSDQMSGPQVHLRDLALALTAEGHQATILVGGSGPFTSELARLGVRHRSLRHMTAPIRPWRDWRGLRELRSVLAEVKPDLVSTHSSKAGIIGRMAAHDLGIPALHTAHGWAFTRRALPPVRWLYRRMERFAAAYGQRIVTVSEFDRSAALDGGVGDAATVVAVHNGVVDTPERALADPAAEPPRLIMVARLEAQKDHPTLLRALAGLVDRPWSLDIVGDGPRRVELEQSVADLGLSDRVRFRGARNDVPVLLAQAQIFLLISHFEGFPRSILEAMRAGLPVIATDVAGVAEAVADGDSGLVVPHGDVAAVAAALTGLLDDPALRRRMGRNGRDRYIEQFTFERMLAQTTAVYEDILSSRGMS